MRKLLTFLVALASIAFAVASPARADCMVAPGIPPSGTGCAMYYPPPAAAGPTYTFLGSTDTYVTGGTTETLTVTLNNAAGRLIVAINFVIAQPTTVVCQACGTGGTDVNLSSDASGTAGSYWSFWGGNIVASSASVDIVVIYSGGGIGYSQFSAVAWNGSNLTTGFVASSTQAVNSTTITTASGELLFAVAYNAAGVAGCNFATSTQTPTGSRLSTIVSPNSSWFSASADWAAPTPSSPFTAAANCSGGSNVVAATYK